MQRILTEEQRDHLRECFEDCDLIWDSEIHLYPLYSGRFMYGEQCFGFVIDEPGKLFFALGYLAAKDQNLSIDLMNSHKTDNMGKDYIVYFPGYLWTEHANTAAINA